MNRKQIEKQLNKDLQKATPSSFDEIKARCGIAERETVKEEVLVLEGANGGTASVRPQRKGVFAVLLAAILALGLIAGYFIHSLSNGFVKPSTSGYFVIDVNPSIELDYDEKGVITEAIGLNDDGEALLTSLDLVGKKYDKATEEIFDRCVKLGYFSAARQNNAVLVSANTEKGKADNKLASKMKQLLEKNFKDKNIDGAVLTGASETKSLSSTAKAYGIDAQKYAFILSCKAQGVKVDESEYASVSVSELHARLSKKQKKDKKQALDEEVLKATESLEELLSKLSSRIEKIVEKLDEALEKIAAEENPPPPPQGEQPQNQHTPPIFSSPKDRYEQYKLRLGEYLEELVEDIEDSKSIAECSILVNEILATLLEMQLSENDLEVKQLLASAHLEIKDAYDEIVKEFSYFNYVNSSPKEKEEARLDKFDDEYEEEDDEFDFDEEWSKKEDDFYDAWYKLKAEWQKERDRDFR